jgi:hypothetical protein
LKARTNVTITKSKRDGANQSVVKAEPSVTELGSASTNNSSSSSALLGIEKLPDFCRSTWSLRFLPTLYHRLGAAAKPWELSHGESASGMVEVIQEILDYSYPGTTYSVKYGDRIFVMVITTTCS